MRWQDNWTGVDPPSLFLTSTIRRSSGLRARTVSSAAASYLGSAKLAISKRKSLSPISFNAGSSSTHSCFSGQKRSTTTSRPSSRPNRKRTGNRKLRHHKTSSAARVLDAATKLSRSETKVFNGLIINRQNLSTDRNIRRSAIRDDPAILSQPPSEEGKRHSFSSESHGS